MPAATFAPSVTEEALPEEAGTVILCMQRLSVCFESRNNHPRIHECQPSRIRVFVALFVDGKLGNPQALPDMFCVHTGDIWLTVPPHPLLRNQFAEIRIQQAEGRNINQSQGKRDETRCRR